VFPYADATPGTGFLLWGITLPLGVPPPAEGGFSQEIHWVASTGKCSSDTQPFAFASQTTAA